MRIEGRCTIEVPRQQVWDTVSDVTRAADFMEGFGFWAIDGEPTTGERARYTVRAHVRSAEVGGVVEVIEWDPPHEVAWTSITGIQQRGRWILHGQGKRTEVILRLQYQAPGGLLAVLADHLGGRILKRNVRASLGNLKRMLEVR
ncbi:MAG: SRPBCC family protein [Solirubrobacterales bacterium]